jgi:hypothetical protein
MEELGLEKYSFTISNLTYDTLMSAVDDIWDNRERIKKQLGPKIVKIEERALLNTKLIDNLLA